MLRIVKYLFVLLPIVVSGQQFSLKGTILNETGEGMPYATAVLLDPSDSTLQYYGISNFDGTFEIPKVKGGEYLLQVAFMGFETHYRMATIPLENTDDLGIIVMKTRNLDLDGVDIVSERIPMRIKKDTLEFDAAAFKTKPDAVTEDLLKKMPGIEVDRAGNIKALGEDVRVVLVDGKEFFGNDPKIATRNLPADALNKVQVFDKRSDESEFTGVDDGQRNKAINLVLKDDKKKGLFGDVEAGAGTDAHYKGAGKVYRFSDKTQFAALGMLNNINQFGFSFNDYLNFSGGLSSLMAGGSGQLILGADDGFPVNFGKPVSGLTTSGAGGLNFSFSKKKHNRVFISYLGNGYDKKLEETTRTRNFTPQGNYEQHQESNETPQNYAHNMNFGLRQRIDSTQNFILNGKLAFTHGKVPGNSVSLSHNNDTLVNSLFSKTNDKSNGVSGSVNGSYQNKLNSNKTVLKLTADLALTKGLTNTRFENKAMYYYPPGEVITNQFQDKNSESLNYSLSTSLLQHLWRSVTIEPKIRFGQTFESMNRQQGTPAPSETIIDSLSPDFDQRHDWLRPEVGIRRNTDKTRFMAGLGFETGRTHNSLWDDDSVSTSYHALLPRLSWEYDYRTGKRLSLYYYTSVNTPPIQMLQPVVNNSNPLFLTYGNRYLEPEYLHNLQLTWLLFDQFSFTSLFTSLNATYAVNKINWDRTINDQLVQWMKPVNVSDDLSLEGGIDFSTPIRKFGIEVSANIRETYNRGINIINGTSNVNTNLSHRFSLSFDNRKKNKWDVITGAAMQMTNSQYSVQESLDNKYFDLSWFAEVSFNPNDSWNFMVSADVTNYTAQSFDKPVSIPLVNAEINHYFLKNNRGVISLNIFDMLDQNTGLQRTGDMNYLMEKQSNIIGRYAMVSFKYRLNKFGDNGGGVDVEINRR